MVDQSHWDALPVTGAENIYGVEYRFKVDFGLGNGLREH